MAEPAAHHMSVEEFFLWQERQTERFELVDGIPVPLRAMTGASRQHDRITVNLVGELRNRLRGKPCVTFTPDTAVRTRPGTLRRPDAGVDCGPFRPDERVASEPTLVVEVLSPSTRATDLFQKTDEFRNVATIAYILLIEPNEARVLLRARDEEGNWHDHLIEGLDAAVDLPRLGISLPLAEIYADVPLRPRPRLLEGFDEDGQPVYWFEEPEETLGPAER